MSSGDSRPRGSKHCRSKRSLAQKGLVSTRHSRGIPPYCRVLERPKDAGCHSEVAEPKGVTRRRSGCMLGFQRASAVTSRLGVRERLWTDTVRRSRHSLSEISPLTRERTGGGLTSRCVQPEFLLARGKKRA